MTEQDRNIFFTVFTPTYNRAHLLPRVYESLLGQTVRDFEWIIVDDGSTDSTGELVKGWMKEAHFPISYCYQPNSGKHVAINRGVEQARGVLMVIVDSDDWLAPNSLERIRETWLSIPEQIRPQFVGVVGLYAYPSGKAVGEPFPVSVLDADAVSIRAIYGVTGDKFGANRVDVYRQFPFPEHLGRFVPEGIVWNRMARQYKSRFVNEIWAYTEYQSDGLSARSLQLRVQNPMAARIYYLELVQFPYGRPVPLFLLRSYVNLVRFTLHARYPLAQLWREVPHKWALLLALPAGTAAYWRDCLVVRKASTNGKAA